MEELSEWKQFLAGNYRDNPHRTPEQNAYQFATWCEYEDYYRARNNAFEIWRECKDKQCLRGRVCLADPAECARDYFRELPPAAKFWIKIVMDVHCGGTPIEEALRAATAKLHRRELFDELPTAATLARIGTALRRLAAQDRLCSED